MEPLSAPTQKETDFDKSPSTDNVSTKTDESLTSKRIPLRSTLDGHSSKHVEKDIYCSKSDVSNKMSENVKQCTTKNDTSIFLKPSAQILESSVDSVDIFQKASSSTPNEPKIQKICDYSLSSENDSMSLNKIVNSTLIVDNCSDNLDGMSFFENLNFSEIEVNNNENFSDIISNLDVKKKKQARKVDNKEMPDTYNRPINNLSNAESSNSDFSESKESDAEDYIPSDYEDDEQSDNENSLDSEEEIDENNKILGEERLEKEDCSTEGDKRVDAKDKDKVSDSNNKSIEKNVQQNDKNKKKVVIGSLPEGVGGIDKRKLIVDSSEGKKSYTKKYCCLYCNKLDFKIARHLETHHREEERVKLFLALPPKNPERKKLIEALRKEGNLKHNQLQEINKGNLIPERRPNVKYGKNAEDFLACPYCQGTYSVNNLRNHIRKYHTNEKVGPGRTNLTLGRKVETRIHEIASNKLRTEVFPLLRHDEIVNSIKYDKLVITYANKMCQKYKKVQDAQMIRGKLRLLGRILLAARTVNSNVTDMTSVFRPKNYDVCIQAIKTVAGFDETTDEYKAPTTALESITLIKLVGEILANECLRTEAYDEMKLVEDFLKLLNVDSTFTVKKQAHEQQQHHQRYKKIELPKTSDIRKLHDYLESKIIISYDQLKKHCNLQNWKELAGYTLTMLQIFNRRRAGETERLMIANFESRVSIETCAESNDLKNLNVTAIEKLKKYKHIDLEGKLGRKVPMILTELLEKSMMHLIKTRKKVSIPEENPFVFGLPGNGAKRIRYLKACVLLRRFSIACNASKPETLRGTLLRKHIATQCITYDLAKNEEEQVAKYLGHNLNIHKDYYQVPSAVRDLVLVREILEKGQGKDKEDSENEEMENRLSDLEDEVDSELEENDEIINSLFIEEPQNDVTLSDDLLESSQETGDKSCQGIATQKPLCNMNSEYSTAQCTNSISRKGKVSLLKSTTQKSKKSNCSFSVSRKIIKKTKKKGIDLDETTKRRSVKKPRWSEEAKNLILTTFAKNIKSKTLPSLSEIQKIKANNECLDSHEKCAIKTWISNQFSRK